MLYISSYVVFLFTIQLILILSKTPSWWLIALWGLLFFYVYRYRWKFYYPGDHPHAWNRKRMVAVWLASLLFLCASHVYFSFLIQQKTYSPISAYMEAATVSPQDPLVDEEPIYVTGTILSPISIDGDRVSYTLNVDSLNQEILPRSEKIIVQHYLNSLEERDKYTSVSRRDYWGSYVLLNKPSSARNPGAFDYKNYLSREHIYFVGRVIDPEWKHQPSDSWLGKWLNHVDQQRNRWLQQVEAIFSEDIVPIVQAMTMGYRDELAPELVEMYQQLGIIHILAISGLHVVIILWGLYRLLSLLPITREKIYLVLMIFLPLYMYLSGGQVSAIRAGLMGMVALIFLRFQWWKHSLLGLYAVYVAMLFYNPFYLYHIGFQLSFAVTFILITAYPSVEKNLSILPKGVRQVVGIAVLAQIASLPIILVHFYQFSPMSLLINILLVPIYSFIFIPAAFLLTLLSYIHTDLVSLFILFYEGLLGWIHQGLFILQEFPYAVLSVGRPSAWWLGIYIGIMVSFFILIEKGKGKLAWAQIALLVLCIGSLLIYPYFDHKAKIMVLDVGQGDAIVIELPFREEVILIDLGGQTQFIAEEWMQRKKEFEVGRDVILPYLRFRGINTVHKVINTHGHYDHFGGVQGLLGKINIEQVFRSPVYPQSEFEKEWLAKIAEENIPIYSLGQGDQWGTEHAFFHALFPQKKEKLGTDVNNLHDWNIVLWNQIYETTFLWTGDVEEYGESAIVEEYPELQADIVKIAHHGSQTSTSEAWLKQIKAQIGLISVGRNNRFGHPHPIIIERLAEEGLEVYRTDNHGGIMIQIKPQEMDIIPTLQ